MGNVNMYNIVTLSYRVTY